MHNSQTQSVALRIACLHLGQIDLVATVSGNCDAIVVGKLNWSYD